MLGFEASKTSWDGLFAQGRTLRIGRQPVVVAGKGHDGIRPPRTQYAVGFGLRNIPPERKVRVGRETFHLLPNRRRRMGSHDRKIYIVYLHRYGEAEQQQLHHGDTQYDEHRAAVAQDVEHLLFDE